MITEEMKEGKNPEEIVQMLKDNCVRSEHEMVKRYFTDDELQEMRVELTETSIERHDKQERLKEQSKAAKDEIANLTNIVNSNLKHLKKKFTEQSEEVYLLDDQDEGVMYTYSSTGDLISTRKLFPNERQTRIKQLKKTA